MTSAVQCAGADFCEEISGAADTAFARFYEGDPPSRRVYSTPDFELLVDMSPLTVGHLLLLPRAHHLSFARVLAAHPDETELLVERITALYAETSREPLVPEHGSGVDQESHACMTHARLHFLPVDGGVVDAMLAGDGLRYRDLPSLGALARPPWLESAYFLRLFDGRCRVYVPSAAQKRQYLRSLAGAALSIRDPEWDYAVVVRKDDLRTTMRRVADWPDRLARAGGWGRSDAR
ncbi:hypothetical protein GCM10022243_34660 [Saccharothrix violaceirubra]|uniref:Diadenosine tetraphosphate (Ap4A) HIT family hydrolase n=1 Tax=Saccharothrix violaceirubra TaxID=413306 RepID=A0A7W7T4P1_9PSEU|nr:hypothetical protein [Saccharothrix violaceirubra]MBB4966518.1 diadenosine tetraphosphate (Ap4A) HIT family hydrolase [Saccharothrix violaceirubra]